MSPSRRDASGRPSAVSVGLRRVARLAVLAGVPTFGLVAAAYAFGLRLNISPSIAPGVYRVTNEPVERGATVIVCLPTELSALARARDYISAGSCADGNAPIGKRVAALPGDTVALNSRGLSVNGHALPNTRPLARDHEGRPLPHLAYGQYLVNVGQIWLVSTYSSRSFDSRYFGPVPASSIVSRVSPLITLR